MMTGRIVKGIAGFYYVAVAESGIYSCKAKGIFRKEGKKPLVGDQVEIEILDEADREASIIRILPRKNELYRPAVANLDRVMVVFALREPDPNPGILDRFLVQMKRRNIDVVICLNKRDLDRDGKADILREDYENAGYRVLVCCANDPADIEEIRRILKGGMTVMTGPSGVGKSTIVNALVPDAGMETGDISRKLRRGRNTTRHSELLAVSDDTYLCDTPGFTSFIPEEMKKEELKGCFAEFAPYKGQCRFLSCVHVDEPDCAVKEAVAKGRLSGRRYESYRSMFEELKERERR